MSDRPIPPGKAGDDAERPQTRRKRYESPRLIDYGAISKLTQSGGITTKDSGAMFQRGPCL